MKFKFLLAGLFLSFQAQAASELVEKNQALAVVKNYAKTIACENTFEKNEFSKILTTSRDAYIIEKGNSDWEQTTVLILWGGDIGCAGGSGSQLSVLTELAKLPGRDNYIVISNYPFGEDVDKHINYGFISEFKQLNENLFKITSGKFADDDSNAGPSLQDTILVKKQEGIGWKVISSRLSKIY